MSSATIVKQCYAGRMKPTCTVPECSAESRANSLCARHYATERRRRLGKCSLEGCDKRQHASGLCSMHYARRTNTGDVGPIEPLIGRSGPGRSISQNGYMRVRVGGKFEYEHRVVAADHGIIDGLNDPRHVHHVDGDKLNNDPSNLEALAASDHATEHHPRTKDWERARELYEQEGMSTVQVAREIGTHPGNVWRRLQQQGAAMRPNGHSEEFRSEVLAYLSEHRNKSQTARHFGISRSTVDRFVAWVTEHPDAACELGLALRSWEPFPDA